MDPFCIVLNDIFCQSLVKADFVMDKVKIWINKFFLDCPVKPFHKAVCFRTMRIRKKMGNISFFKLLIKISQVFSSIIRLPVFNPTGIAAFKLMVEIFVVSAGLSFVV